MYFVLLSSTLTPIEWHFRCSQIEKINIINSTGSFCLLFYRGPETGMQALSQQAIPGKEKRALTDSVGMVRSDLYKDFNEVLIEFDRMLRSTLIIIYYAYITFVDQTHVAFDIKSATQRHS